MKENPFDPCSQSWYAWAAGYTAAYDNQMAEARAKVDEKKPAEAGSSLPLPLWMVKQRQSQSLQQEQERLRELARQSQPQPVPEWRVRPLDLAEQQQLRQLLEWFQTHWRPLR